MRCLKGQRRAALDDRGPGPAQPKSTMQFEIEDNGQGFPVRSASACSSPTSPRAPRAPGLGLAIVKKIMEEHGGTVELLAGETGGALVRLGFPMRGS